jgi:hypothetical protein
LPNLPTGSEDVQTTQQSQNAFAVFTCIDLFSNVADAVLCSTVRDDANYHQNAVAPPNTLPSNLADNGNNRTIMKDRQENPTVLISPPLWVARLEIRNICGTALPDSASGKEREWAQNFNNIHIVAELEDDLLQYGQEAKAASWVELPRQPRTRRPRPQETNALRRRQQQMYDAKAGSLFTNLSPMSATRLSRSV